jgi:hypothetical protein
LIAFPPGGPTDFVGRLLADKMSTLLGQRVYMESAPTVWKCRNDGDSGLLAWRGVSDGVSPTGFLETLTGGLP